MLYNHALNISHRSFTKSCIMSILDVGPTKEHSVYNPPRLTLEETRRAIVLQKIPRQALGEDIQRLCEGNGFAV